MTVLYYIPQKKTTTLATVGGITSNSQTANIKLGDVTGVDITKPGIVCLSWSSPMDDSKYEYISYTSIDGTNVLSGVVRGAEGSTARDSHASGSTVAFVFSKSHINNINDEFNARVVATGAEVDTGTDNAKYTSPKSIADSGVLTATNTKTTTNKRNQPKIVSAASYTTDTGTALSIATCDEFIITAQAGALKFNNPGGTPAQGEKLIIRIKDDGTARNLTYDTYFRALGVPLPTTTVLGKTLYLGFIYNSTDTKWDLVAGAQEA